MAKGKQRSAELKADPTLRCFDCGKVKGVDMVLGIQLVTCPDGNLRCQACLATPCSACGIIIGDGFEETTPHAVGHYKLCGYCYPRLIRYGRRKLRELSHGVDYLFPDGRTEIRKSRYGIDKALKWW